MVLRDVTELRRLERRAPGIRRQRLARAAHAAGLDPGGGRDARGRGGGRPGGGRRLPAGGSSERSTTSSVWSTSCWIWLGWSRDAPSSRSEACDPVDMLMRAVERLRPQVERAGLVLRVEVSPDLPQVRVDRGRIEQVLINLIHNAVKFTPEGGEIVVSAGLTDGMLRVSVRDTGVGITAEELPRIFERFYKTDAARRSAGPGWAWRSPSTSCRPTAGRSGQRALRGTAQRFPSPCRWRRRLIGAPAPGTLTARVRLAAAYSARSAHDLRSNRSGALTRGIGRQYKSA